MESQTVVYQAPSLPTDAPERGRKQILIIDDESGITSLLAEILDSPTWEVLTANETREGLRIALFSRPDLILLDITMPEFDGIDILKQLKHMRATEQIPIIMLTGHHSADTVSRALEAGADDYIVKPFLPDFLIERVERWLSLAP